MRLPLVLVAVLSAMLVGTLSTAPAAQAACPTTGEARVGSEADLRALSGCALPAAVTVSLVANIVLDGPFTPITSLAGTFNGNNYTIYGPRIEEDPGQPQGLIGTLEPGATVEYLILNGPSVAGTTPSAGALAGFAQVAPGQPVTVRNVTVRNAVVTGSGTGLVTGGVIGAADIDGVGTLTLTDVGFSGGVFASGDTGIVAGGVLGGLTCDDACSVTLSRVASRTPVQAGVAGTVGGIVGRFDGYAAHVTLDSVYATGALYASNLGGTAGGLIGAFTSGYAAVSTSYFGGSVAGYVTDGIADGSTTASATFASAPTRAFGATYVPSFDLNNPIVYTDAAWDISGNWDDGKVWTMCAANGGMPILTYLYFSNPCVAPTAPTAVQTVPGSAKLDRVQLSFDPPLEGGDLSGLEYQLDGGQWQSLYPVVTSPITITGLQSQTGYTVRLRATNEFGIGPESDPYTFSTTLCPVAATTYVTSVDDLRALRGCTVDAGQTIELANDIATPNGFEFTDDSITRLNGTFDGNGHAIRQMVLRPSQSAPYAGLFGAIGASGVVENLTLDRPDLQWPSSDYSARGTVAGTVIADGTIRNVDVLQPIVRAPTAGGVVGRLGEDALMTDVHVIGGTITSSGVPNAAGGLVGSIDTGRPTITQSSSTAQVTGGDAGGLVGVS